MLYRMEEEECANRERIQFLHMPSIPWKGLHKVMLAC